jgi:hypothetical protein
MHETGFGYVGLASRGTTHYQDIHRVDGFSNHAAPPHTRENQAYRTIFRQKRSL